MASLNVENLFELIVPGPPTVEERVQNWSRLTEVLRIMGDTLRVKRCTATATWVDGGTPTVAVADNDTADTFSLLLPRVAGKDPNVRSGDSFFYKVFQGAYYPEGDGYLDDKKLTQKNWAGLLANIPQGWAVCDGVANSVGNGGSGLDLSGRFLKWSGVAGTTGSSDTGSAGAHSGNTGLTATGLTVDDASLTVSTSTTGITMGSASLTISTDKTGITIDAGGPEETDTAGIGITINSASVAVNSAVTNVTVDDYDLEFTGLETTDLTIDNATVTVNNSQTGVTLGLTTPGNHDVFIEPGATGIGLHDPGHGHTTVAHNHDTTEVGHKHSIEVHNHDITDPGHSHTTSAHSHGYTDPFHFHDVDDHVHTITDPGHFHTVADHSHILSDPGHLHTIADHGHAVSETAHLHSFSVPAHTHTAGEPPYISLIPIERVH